MGSFHNRALYKCPITLTYSYTSWGRPPKNNGTKKRLGLYVFGYSTTSTFNGEYRPKET